MKKVIVQHCTIEQQQLFDLSRPFNQSYAERLGYDYITNSVRRCPNRSIYWEKIAYLREVLPTIEEGSLVVWEDADSINIKDECFAKALHSGTVLGMVQCRAGVDMKDHINWYNAGVIIMKNCHIVRDFLNRVWVRKDETDESAINAELKHNGWTLGDGSKIASIDCKWNRWRNNEHLCPKAVVQSWHGVHMDKKLPAMTEFLDKTAIVSGK